MIILFTAIVMFLFFVIYEIAKSKFKCFSTIMYAFGVFSAVILFLEFVFSIGAHIGTEGLIDANKHRYESLVYQLENNLYDNDNDIGKKQLYDEIREWNEDLAYGKSMQHDVWFGIFYSNIYDNFDFIPLN